MARLLAALLAIGALGAPALAQLPNQPLRIVAGFAAGGTSDLTARLVADAVAPLLNRRVLVENRTGATGMIAAEAVARSAPDGATMYQCSSLIAVLPELPGMRLPVDPLYDIVPVANVAQASQAMVVAADGPYRTLADVLAAARAQPGRLTYASSGIGALSHLSGARLAQLAGISLVHVPYRGAAIGLLDVVGGRTDMMITNLADVTGQVRGGTLRLLGFADGIGSPLFPDAPQIEALVPGYRISGWFGICGPRGLPAEVLAVWEDAIRTAVAGAPMQERLLANGLNPRFEDAQTFGRTMQADRLVWRDTVRAANIRAE